MLDVPRPRVLPEFKRLAHGLRSSNISVLDAKTFYIPNLHYDGAGVSIKMSFLFNNLIHLFPLL